MEAIHSTCVLEVGGPATNRTMSPNLDQCLTQTRAGGGLVPGGMAQINLNRDDVSPFILGRGERGEGLPFTSDGADAMLTYRRYLGIGVLLGAKGYLCMVGNVPF